MGEGRGHRSMHDIRPDVEGGTVAANLAAAFGVTTAQVEAALPLVAAELGACLEQVTLSRAGLVAFVEGIGGRWAGTLDQCEALHSQSMRASNTVFLWHRLHLRIAGELTAYRYDRKRPSAVAACSRTSISTVVGTLRTSMPIR